MLDLVADAEALLADDSDLPSRDTYLSLARTHANEGGIPALRRFKRIHLLSIAARDAAGEIGLEEVGRALSDLADAVLTATIENLDPDVRLAVIGMGKLGGRELNYSSDIDLIFVSDGDPAPATKVAEAVLVELGAVAPEGQAYRIDVDLRPEGRSGSLVRSVESCLEYYRRWAEPWEFQALIKARAAAGDERASSEFVSGVVPLIYSGEESPERVVAIRRMKERLEEHAARSARRIKTTEASDLKLGPGGIRDIEFSIQLLQLVHGPSDESVRDRSTLGALDQLSEGGYMAEDDAAGLGVAYRWLRTVEHRLQLWQERQVHHLPRADEGKSRLARSLGFKDSPSESSWDRFEARHRAVLADVRGRFERLFYRPMIESLADPAGGRLSPEALRERLRILGFRDVDRAVRILAELVAGTSRRARLFRVLTPALLRWLASTPLPDRGLFSFLRLGESVETRLEALAALRDNPPGLEFLARVLGSGRLLGDVLLHVPEEIATIADPRRPGPPKERDRLVREARASLEWRIPERRLDGLRRFKRREMLSVALSDLASQADVEDVGRGLADLADACLEAALEENKTPFAVVGMGKLGGRELSYASDIDVMFVHAGDPLAAERVAEDLMRAIGEVTPEGQAFRIDAGLRPEGKSGPLVRSLDSYLEYYVRWAEIWEHQALLKARPVAGDAELGRALVDATRRFAYPGQLSPEHLARIRHLKARMEKERIPRGIDPRRHAKLGPGGTSDVEFAVQILQLLHAQRVPELRIGGTIAGIQALRAAKLISASDSEILTEAYRFLERLRNRMFFIFARPVDALPVKPEELEAIGIAMGYVDQPRQQLEENYLRITRRTRRVAEPIIYG